MRTERTYLLHRQKGEPKKYAQPAIQIKPAAQSRSEKKEEEKHWPQAPSPQRPPTEATKEFSAIPTYIRSR